LYGMVGNDLISSVDKLGKIKWKEIKYCGLTLSIKRACCCLRAKSIADRVNELMQKRYGGQIDDGQTNALKHCIWNCKMARSFCGKKRAKKISSAHEDFEDNDANRKKMDLHNNQIGINLSGKDGNCVDLCETALKERKLWWFETDGDKIAKDPNKLNHWGRFMIASSAGVNGESTAQNPATGWEDEPPAK
jgi:hypothetical protein